MDQVGAINILERRKVFFLRQRKPAVKNTVVHAAALEAQEASSEKPWIILSAKHIFFEDDLPLETFLLLSKLVVCCGEC